MEEKLIDYLKNKYHPVAIILYGSHASGKATPQSDWDFAVFVDKEVEGGSDMIDNQTVDADIIMLPITADGLIHQFDGTLQSARVVFDTNNTAHIRHCSKDL